MSKENFTIRIENALQALDWADQILWDVGDAEASEEVYADGEEAPWAAAQTLVFQAMCLLIDFPGWCRDCDLFVKRRRPRSEKSPAVFLPVRPACSNSRAVQ